MDNNFTNNEKILIDYIDGLVTPEQRLSIESRLKMDENFQQEYKNLILAKEAVRNYGLVRKVSLVHQKMMVEMQSPVKNISTGRNMAKMVSAVAAAVVLIVAGYWFFNMQQVSSEKIFASNYKTYEIPVVRDNEQQSAIVKAYSNKDYNSVVKITEVSTSNTAQDFFLTGAAALELKDAAKAIANFSTVLAINKNSSQSTYKDEAEYYLALAYIQNNNNKSADSLLQKIKQDVEHKYNSFVTSKLINQVEKLVKN